MLKQRARLKGTFNLRNSLEIIYNSFAMEWHRRKKEKGKGLKGKATSKDIRSDIRSFREPTYLLYVR